METHNIHPLKLNDLLKELKVRRTKGVSPEVVAVGSIETDSRKVRPGSVFVAVKGTQTDGNLYIPKAIESGAAAIVCESIPSDYSESVCWIETAHTDEAAGLLASAFYGHPSRKLTLVGVTGTNGKTTIATLLYETARMRGLKAGLLSTVVNKIDEEAVEATHTTPDPLELNALLARMVEAGCTFAAMEVSSHAADQKRIAGLDFDGAIFTNITRDHLDYHKTFDNYLKAKKSFFDGLKPEAFALINADDRNGRVMVQNTRAHVYTYSVSGEADFTGRIVENRMDGMCLSLDGKETETLFSGRFNAQNLTAVYGAGVLCGLDRDMMRVVTSALVPVAGRFQCFRNHGITAVVDYAHTPDALVNVLDTIRDIMGQPARPSQKGQSAGAERDEPAGLSAKPGGRGRIITVFGAGGDRDRGKRPIMGREASLRSDIVMITSDNPRTEKPFDIIADIWEGIPEEARAKTLVNPEREAAVALAIGLARPGDVVLVAGKGHEDYQVIGTEKHHCDDRETVCRCLGLDYGATGDSAHNNLSPALPPSKE